MVYLRRGMSPSKHWLDTLEKVRRKRAADALHAAQHIMRRTEWRALKQSIRDDPARLRLWHQQLAEAQRDDPHVASIYYKMRESLWSCGELDGLNPKARRILEIVIELARDEALPWYVAVGAEEVRRLARTSTKKYVLAAKELEGLAITRPARMFRLIEDARSVEDDPKFLGEVDEITPQTPIAQWIVRYRKGLSWNRNRSAWWINYDLLCGTGRVQRCFVFSPNERDAETDDALTELEETLFHGAPPPLGCRAPLWREGVVDRPI